MNTHSNHENPELTAYALGELEPGRDGQVQFLLSAAPGACDELREIETITDALRQGAPIPQERLHPAQRQTVLRPPAAPRAVQPAARRPAPKAYPSYRFVSAMLKAAALIAITFAAFSAGRHTAPAVAAATPAEPPAAQEETPPAPPAPALAEAESAPAAQPMAVTATEPAPAREAEAAPVIVHAPQAPAAEPPAAVEAAPAKPAPEPAPAIVAQIEAAKPEPAAAPAPQLTAQTRPGRSATFVSTTRQAADQFALRPSDIRPLPAKPDASALLAAPLPAKSAANTAKEAPKSRVSEVYIHAWNAEVTSCPWNPDLRLMRINVQLPADQPAARAGGDYPLNVAFDPNTVREYRQICERHLPAAELRSAGTHSVWYEFLPNGRGEGVRTIATVTLPSGRFTTQTVGPFDGSKLLVQDRGQTWESARDDMVFESAVVGFGMLLRGVGQTPRLNHELVLSLAAKAKGTDATGERQRFIRQVLEARKAAGLDPAAAKRS